MCDTVVVVTPDGVLFAKNSDRDANECQNLEWRPAADHPAGAMVACTHISIPQATHTVATLLCRPWWMFGAEMGANEHGVVIGNEAVYTTAPDGDAALTGMDLVRLALERARTADEAAQVIVDLLERHGQGGPCSRERPTLTYHNSFLVADGVGAIVVETAGREWATERVTHGVRSISNGLTIDGFAATFARRTKGRAVACAVRRELTAFGAATTPTVPGLMAALRSHGSTGLTWSPVHGALGAPCVHAGGIVSSSQTTGSLVARLGASPSLWVTGTSAPCLGLFKPVSVTSSLELTGGTDVFGAASPWWQHEQWHRRALVDLERCRATIGAAQEKLERAWWADPPTSAEAFATAAEVGATWARSLPTDLRETRPNYVQWRWADLNRTAAIPRR